MIAAPTQQLNIQSLAQAPMPQADADRKRQMREAWKAYRGELQDPLKVKANQPNDNVKTNRCAPIVDKGVSFLFGQTLKIECGNPEEKSDYQAAMQTFVDGMWGDDDDKMTLLSKLGTNGGVCGQCFLKIIPPQGAMKYPRMVALDPQLVRIVTPPDDCDLILAFIIEYPLNDEWQKRQIIARVDPDGLAGIAGDYDLDDTWTITTYMRRGQAGSWSKVGEQDVWPWPFPPIFTNQNMTNPNEPWGLPDLTNDIIELNQVLNFIESNTSRILKYHAHPKTWGKGFRASQMTVGVDDVFIIEAMDGTLQNLEMHSDLKSSLTFIQDLRASMDELSRIPGVATGRLVDFQGLARISGIALMILYQPLIEKTTQKQRLYGRLIREVCRAALVMAGLLTLEEYEAYPIELHWQDLLPVDDLEAAQTATMLQNLGVSRQTLLAQLGFDPDDEAEKSQAEAAKKMVDATRGQAIPPAGQQMQIPMSPVGGNNE